MANLVVRDVDAKIVKALNAQAERLGVSVETEHRRILEATLIKPAKRSLAEVLRSIPNVGHDSNFQRIQDD